eukprot:316612-Chlamydomonas_euryale.AAC.3
MAGRWSWRWGRRGLLSSVVLCDTPLRRAFPGTFATHLFVRPRLLRVPELCHHGRERLVHRQPPHRTRHARAHVHTVAPAARDRRSTCLRAAHRVVPTRRGRPPRGLLLCLGPPLHRMIRLSVRGAGTQRHTERQCGQARDRKQTQPGKTCGPLAPWQEGSVVQTLTI